MRYCEKCGSELKDGTLFCEKCGAKIEKEKKVKKEEVEEVPMAPIPSKPPKQRGGKGKVVFLSILTFILLATTITFLVLWLVKGSSCGSSGSNGGSGNGGSTINKKEKRTVEYLLDQYVKAYTKADFSAVKDIFPPFYMEYAKNYLTQEKLNTSLKNAKAEYGNDFNITYKVTDTVKMTSSELDELNEKMKKYYNADAKAKECYKIEGTITFKGSKYEDTDPLNSSRYCNYSGTWYLVQG